ncbi:MAG: matrixin family metalloprotease, partial [Myxococcales bacterium]|nr:matrixin family metalloprotease [Myxococcales bacterium]
KLAGTAAIDQEHTVRLCCQAFGETVSNVVCADSVVKLLCETELEPYYVYYNRSEVCQSSTFNTMRCDRILVDLERAVDYYNDIYNGTLFKLVNYSEKAEIIVEPQTEVWGSLYPVEEERLGIAKGYIFRPPVNVKIGITQCSRPIIAIHELGHILGMSHVDDRKNIMAAKLQGCLQKFNEDQNELIKNS